MISVTGNNVTLESVWQIGHKKYDGAKLSTEARQEMEESRRYLMNRLEKGEIIYGVNTGFGALSNIEINKTDIEKLQINFIRSHSSGVGPAFSPVETRAIMYLRANALARGHSGIRPALVDKILEFLKEDILPIIPQQGSVGASGDLAPLAHLSLALIGEGKVWHEGRVYETKEILKAKNIVPLKLEAKEGLSLVNGCQVMTAVGLIRAHQAKHLCLLADISGAMTLEAARGSRKAYDPLLAEVRPHYGEKQTADNLRLVLGKNSEIGDSHINCKRVQDAYSLRCMAAVHGATKHAIKHNIMTLEIEANASTDNPLVFHRDNKILSCGNFHGEPVAFAMDYMGLAITAMGSMCERRIEKLITPHFSELPAFLAPKGGLNNGHMIAQYAAASLVSENQVLSHPASVASVPTSAGKEDHVSMGTIAARKFGSIVDNVKNIVAIEFLSACQALDLLKPLKPTAGVLAAYQVIRKHVPFAEEDRVFADDIKKIADLIDSGEILEAVEKSIGELAF